MFRRLRTKLTVLYAAMFAAALLAVSIGVYVAMADSASRVVRDELAAGGAVFDRVWALQAEEFEQSAALLARDFGFRSAVATGDKATVQSALENLRGRLGIDLAFIIGADGQVTSAGGRPVGDVAADLQPTLQSQDQASGVFLSGGMPYQATATPILAPTTIGWVVFAKKLDRSQMAALERLSSIPLEAVVLHRSASGAWVSPTGRAVSADVDRFLDRSLKSGELKPRRLATRLGPAMAFARPLRSLTPGQPAVLLLRYPLALAMRPYSAMLGIILVVGLLGLALVVAGSWMLARSLTRPLAALDEAVRRLHAGEAAAVAVGTRDEIGRLSVSFNEMSERIRSREAELVSARDQAQAADRAKSTFLANMSHEIRTPLNGVVGAAGALSRSRLDGRQREMVDMVEESAAILQRVLGDVLDMARVEGGQLELRKEAFDLTEAVRAAASGPARECQDKGVEFLLSVDPSADRMVEGDRVRLEQILSALLSNAVKFTGRGRVTLSLDATPGQEKAYRIRVRDTGIGFEPSAAESLFEPFRQADGSDTRVYGGSGLGLSIARDLARAMGGELTGEGAPGRGAVFTLDLPLADAAASIPAQEPEAAMEADEADTVVRVLLVDDNATNRKVVQLILEPLGLELDQAENGQEAVEAFKAAPYDLVLMDIQMPVMDGLTAIRLIRQHESQAGAVRTPIVVVSANAMPEHMAASKAAGADGHLAKPINAAALIGALQEALLQSARRSVAA